MNYDIASGGVSSGLKIGYDESMYIKNGGIASNITNQGNMYISNGGVANDTNNTGSIYIFDGGIANNTYNGGVYVSSGGVANETKINNCYGSVHVFNGGEVNNTTISYGEMHISNGGVANNTAAKKNSFIYISNGGVMHDVGITGGEVWISSGGIATNVFYDWGRLRVFSGGTATIAFNPWGWYDDHIISAAGATVTYLQRDAKIYYSGYSGEFIYKYNSVNYMGICENDSAIIYSGGIANNVMLADGASLEVLSGGTATIAFNPWGYENSNITSASGATVTYLQRDAKIYYSGIYNEFIQKYDSINNLETGGGETMIYSGGVANDTTMRCGVMHISSGGVANDTLVNSRGEMTICSGGVANDTTVNSDCEVNISNGGVASNTTVDDYGYMYIYSGGVASNTTVNYWGFLRISSGGVHRGKLTIDGGFVSAENGAKIDFSVAKRKTSDPYLINAMSRIIGDATYTITVSDSQASGTYKLAQGAEDFYGSITISNSKTNFGYLAVNGADLKYNDRLYSLDKTGGNLTLTISGEPKDTTPPVKPVAKANITAATNKNVTVTASFSSDSTLKQYSLDKKSWKTYNSGIVMKNNGSVYFRGRDKAGNYSAITTYTVKNIDRAAPVISKLTATSKNLVITAKDNVKIAKYVVTVGKKKQTITDNTLALGNLPIGKVAISVVAYDAAGNKSSAKKVNLTIKDTTPPSKVVTLKNPVVTGKYKGTFSWSAAKDNSGKIARYEIQLDNGKIYKSTKTGVSISKLTVGKHTYRVRAVDKNKNVGAWSSRKSFTVKDMTAPSNVSVKVKVSGNNAVLTWKKPKDNVGVTKYILTCNGKTVTLKGSVTKYTITGLNKGKYSYSMVAVDAANNKSKAKTGKITIKQPLAPARAAEALYAADFAAPEALFAPQTDILAYCNDLQSGAVIASTDDLTSAEQHKDKFMQLA